MSKTNKSAKASQIVASEKIFDIKDIQERNERKRIRAYGGCLWLSEAKKDVISCEKLRGFANMNRSVDIRMGQPVRLKT